MYIFHIIFRNETSDPFESNDYFVYFSAFLACLHSKIMDSVQMKRKSRSQIACLFELKE